LPATPQVLTVIVPVYNEAHHLSAVLERLFASPCPIEREWIIVDDASHQILEELAAPISAG
jgi:glycosyltransferase involved in cell wall biosynthesis